MTPIKSRLECLALSFFTVLVICIWLSSVSFWLSYDEMIKFWTEPELAKAIDENCKSDWCKIWANAIDKQENSNHSNGVYLWMITKKFNNADDAMKHRSKVYHTKRYTNTTPQMWINRSKYCVSENNWTKWCPTWVKNVWVFIDQLWWREALDDWLVSDYQPIEEEDEKLSVETKTNTHAAAPRRLCRLLWKGKSKNTNVLVDDWNNNWFIDQSVDNKTGIAKIYKCYYY